MVIGIREHVHEHVGERALWDGMCNAPGSTHARTGAGMRERRAVHGHHSHPRVTESQAQKRMATMSLKKKIISSPTPESDMR